jgi:hypothetical protein
MSVDGIKWHAHAKVIKYEPETVREITRGIGREPTGSDLRFLEARYGLVPDGVSEADGNLLTTAGLNRITNLIIGGGGQAFTNSRAVVGVGNSTTAATVSDADLGAAAGSSNRWFQGVDASNPTQSNGVITCNTTFASADGNFAWQEWCWAVATAAPVASAVFNTATTTGVMLNHKVQSLGTKVSGAVWTLQATITLS